MEIIPIYTPAVQISWLIDKSAHEWLARDGWSDNVLQQAESTGWQLRFEK